MTGLRREASQAQPIALVAARVARSSDRSADPSRTAASSLPLSPPAGLLFAVPAAARAGMALEQAVGMPLATLALEET